jgi:hypothetical protein
LALRLSLSSASLRETALAPYHFMQRSKAGAEGAKKTETPALLPFHHLKGIEIFVGFHVCRLPRFCGNELNHIDPVVDIIEPREDYELRPGFVFRRDVYFTAWSAAQTDRSLTE